MSELPPAPDFENLKKLAKDLFQLYREGDVASIRRVKTIHPAYGRLSARANPPPFTLHDAQLVVAREAGFDSWRAIRQDLDTRAKGEEQQVATFLEVAFLGKGTAAADILKKSPQVAKANFHTALLAGESELALKLIDENRALIKEEGGPKNCAPLVYVAGSSLLQDPARSKRLLKLAKQLLELGADPNAAHIRRKGARSMSLSALYAATSSANHPEMAALLLSKGANPNDGESLYHSTENRDHACLKLLLQHGVKFAGTNAVHRMLDFDDLEGLRLMLEAGADANLSNDGSSLLHWAIMRDRGAAHIKLLLDHGADVLAKNTDGHTPYLLATRLGHKEAVKLLAKKSSKIKLSAKDEFLAACASGDAKTVKATLTSKPKTMKSLSPKDHALLVEAAWRGHSTAVKAMLQAGFQLTARGEMGETALHGACWMGQADVVKALVKGKAPLEDLDESHESTPLGWVIHGSSHARDAEGKALNPDADYAACAETLLAAEAVLKPVERETPEAVVKVIKKYEELEKLKPPPAPEPPPPLPPIVFPFIFPPPPPVS